jgi:hypothetical protein
MKYCGSLYNDMSPLPDGIGGKMLREDGNWATSTYHPTLHLLFS